MHSNYDALQDAVNDCWVGRSAEKFKSNIFADINSIAECFRSTYEILESEINQIVNAMNESEQTIIEGRGE